MEPKRKNIVGAPSEDGLSKTGLRKTSLGKKSLVELDDLLFGDGLPDKRKFELENDSLNDKMLHFPVILTEDIESDLVVSAYDPEGKGIYYIQLFPRSHSSDFHLQTRSGFKNYSNLI